MFLTLFGAVATVTVATLLGFPYAELAFADSGHDWDPALTLSLPSGLESKAIRVTWSTSDFGDCSSVDKVMVRYKEGTTAPAALDAGDGELVGYVPVAGSHTTHVPVHPEEAYAYTVYACQAGAGCPSPCTDVDTATSKGDTATQPEKWVAVDVTAYTDADRVVSDEDAATASVVRMQAGGWEDHIAVYYRTTPSGSNEAGFYVTQSKQTGWVSAPNTHTWSTAKQVLEQTDTAGSSEGIPYRFVKNPLAIITDENTGDAQPPRVRLMWSDTKDPDNSGATDFQYRYIDATEDTGYDFGLECENTDCQDGNGGTLGCNYTGAAGKHYCDFDAVTVTAFLSAPDVATHQLDEGPGWHGRLLYDYFVGGNGSAWDPSAEDIDLLFTAVDDSTCTETGSDDLNVLAWNGSSWTLDQTQEASESPYCTTNVIEDRHDPAVTPYPEEYKVYAKNGHTDWEIGFTTDGVTWDDNTPADWSDVEFYFDDGFGGPGTAFDGGCLEDMATLLFADGSTKRDLAIATTKTDAADNHETCFDDGGLIGLILWNG